MSNNLWTDFTNFVSTTATKQIIPLTVGMLAFEYASEALAPMLPSGALRRALIMSGEHLTADFIRAEWH